jgi:isopropylmalate/homocitrate/citramalate synthase
MIIVDATLTAGVTGQPPLPPKAREAWLYTLRRIAVDWGLKFDVELPLSFDLPLDRFFETSGNAGKKGSLEAILRLEPRADRFRHAREMGAGKIVFSVPVSATAAEARFLHGGLERAAAFAAEHAESAALAGLRPEIELDDSTRARGRDVAKVIKAVRSVLRPRGIEATWRLLDRTGLGDPLPGARRPRSLVAWVRWLDRDHQIDPLNVSVQAADTLGLALANGLAVARMGARPVTTAFGLGHHAGWTALEVLLAQLREALLQKRGRASLRPLMQIRSVLTRGQLLRDPYRPVSGPWSHQAPGGTRPETLEERSERYFPYTPGELTGSPTLPMMDALSGQAGLLYLIHRHFQELHVETTDPEAHALAKQMQDAFDEGRDLPAAWLEVRQLVEESGILARAQARKEAEEDKES